MTATPPPPLPADWDARYSTPGYFYGTEPNDFLRAVADRIPPGRVLMLADGEGRNGVFLAERGHPVVAVDRSPVGLAKARALAERRGVTIETVEADLASFDIAAEAYDGVVAIFCHLPPALRRQVHARAIAGLKPGGAFVLEAYTPAQLAHGTGGPKQPELLMRVEDLRAELSGLDLAIAREVEREIVEGEGHRGTSAVVQVLGFKPSSRASRSVSSLATGLLCLALALAAQPVWAQAGSRGRAITVQGVVDSDSLGMTLMHEHLVSDMLLPDAATGYSGQGPLPDEFARRFQETGRYYRVPRTPEQQAFWDRPNLTPDMDRQLSQGWLTRSMFVLDDSVATLRELADFRAAGGATVVDVTTVGIGRAPERLRALAKRSGVRVVMGTGWYRWPFHPEEIARRSIDQLAQRMIEEIERGVDGTGIRAGIIGEIPLDAAGLRLSEPVSYLYPDSTIVALRTEAQRRIRSGAARLEEIYHPEELKVLQAAARASRATGVAITLHAPDPWIDYLDLLEREGADLGRVVIGHADQILLDDSLARAAFRRGVYLQLDYTLQRYRTGDAGPIDRLLDRVAWAVRQGFAGQILLSLDLCFRQGLADYGGGGFRSFTDRVLPGLRARGLSGQAIRQIVVENPKRVLTVRSPGVPSDD